MRRIEVNGRSYRLPGQPAVVVCVDGCEPDYIAQAVAGGHMPWMKRVLAQGTFGNRRLRRAELHQPEQPVDRHRGAACGARHLRQLPLRSRQWHRGDDERPEVAARADAAGRPGRQAGARSPSSPPRTSCASCSATSMQGHLLLGREGRPGDASPSTASRMCSSSSACRCRSLQRGAVRVRVRRRREADADAAPGRHVPLDHRLRAAQARAGHRRRQRVLPR